MSNFPVTQPLSAGAVTTLREAKQRAEIVREVRREKIRAAEEWIGLAASKALGIGMTGVGGAMAMGFSIGHLHLGNPAYVFGVGVAFLVGSKPLRAVLKFASEADKAGLL
jgi:hypothetical protein